MKREFRREIKRNELVEAVGRSLDYATSHGKLLAAIGVAVVVVVVAAAGGIVYAKGREARAAAVLDRAMKAYAGEIDAAAPKPDDPEAPTFGDEAARRARAKELFAAVASRHRRTGAGPTATAYLGRIAADEGDLERARELWLEVVERAPDHLLAAETRLNLLHLDRRAGRAEEVARELEAMLDAPDGPLPADLVLYELGAVREELGRTTEALSAYQRLVDDYPGSPYRVEARQKATSLAGIPAAAVGTG